MLDSQVHKPPSNNRENDDKALELGVHHRLLITYLSESELGGVPCLCFIFRWYSVYLQMVYECFMIY